MDPLLTTMGILLANYDEGRDYLSNFEPFVRDRLKEWPTDKVVKSKAMSEALTEAFSFPPIPLGTITELLDRAAKDQYLRIGRGRSRYPNPPKLASVNGDIHGRATETLMHFSAIGTSLREYAKTLGVEWSEAEVERAMETLVDEFGVEMAEARQTRNPGKRPAGSPKETLPLIHGFVRHCFRSDPVSFGYLEELVRGSMLTNVLYFKDLGSWEPKIENLVVYVDTPLALRLLGLAPEEQRLGAEEMMEMLKAMKVPVRIFEHTVAEVYGVLEGVRSNLERARQKTIDLNSFTNLNREVIEYLMQQGWGPAEVQAIMANLDEHLQRVGIIVEQPPPITRELSLNETRLEEILLKRSFTKSQAVMDIKSVSAIHRLRKGAPARSFTRARAIFATPNLGLARASAHFMREQGHPSPVGHCISDISLVTHLWLLSSNHKQQVPRKLLVAESFAALDPPQTVWRKYLSKIEQQRQAGQVTEEQVKTLVFSSAAQENLFEVTMNDPDRVGDDTPQEVLARYEEAIRNPVEIEARKTQEELESIRREKERLDALAAAEQDKSERHRTELQRQEERLAELESWKDTVARDRANARARWRIAGGVVAALAVVAAAAALLLAEVVDGSFGFAGVTFLATLAALACLGWGFRKPLRWSTDVLVAAGAILAVFFGLYELGQGFFG